MNEHDEKLRIMALAIRKGIDVRGPESVSILEDAAEFIQFMYEEVYGEEDTECQTLRSEQSSLSDMTSMENK